MSCLVEIKVKISNPEQKYVKKLLHYEPITVCKNDPQLSQIVAEALKEFKGPAEDISVVFNMIW